MATRGADGRLTLQNDFRNYPLSVAVANRLSPSAKPSTTPLAWTRGLSREGLWAPAEAANPGVFGASGGHIVFLDGHVAFYRDLAENGGQLRHAETGEATADLSEALSTGAEGLDSQGKAF